MFSGLTTEPLLHRSLTSEQPSERVDAVLELAWRLRIREVERCRQLVADARPHPEAAGRVAVFELRDRPPTDAAQVLALARRADLDALWSLRGLVVGVDRLIDGLAAPDAEALEQAVRDAFADAAGLMAPDDMQAVENMLGRVAMLFPARRIEAVEHYEQAAAFSALAGDSTTMAINLVNAASTRGLLDDPSGALECYLRALEAAGGGDAPPRVLAFVHGNIANLYQSLGGLSEANQHAEKAVDVARRCDQRYLLLHSLAVRARVCLTLGSLPAAEAAISELAHLAARADDLAGHRSVAQTLRAQWLIQNGRPVEALASLEPASSAELPDEAIAREMVRIQALTSLGRHAEAVACMQPITEQALRTQDPLHDGILDGHVDNLRVLGQHDAAIDFLVARTHVLQSEPRRLARVRMAALTRDVEIRAARASADDANALARGLQAQLLRAQRLESFGQLAAGLAHDVNNTLTVVLAAADILGHLPEGADRSDTLHTLHQAVGQATSLTKRLLAIARQSELSLAEVDLGKHLPEVLGVLQTAAGSCAVKLELTPTPAVLIDPNLLDQALLNLVLNARDAMGERGDIVVATRSVRHRVYLSVSDEGSGIAPSDLQRIFDPFFSTKGDAGTGLGLAMVWGIAQQLGGDVSVDSEVGHGTTFTLELPVSPHR